MLTPSYQLQGCPPDRLLVRSLSTSKQRSTSVRVSSRGRKEKLGEGQDSGQTNISQGPKAIRQAERPYDGQSEAESSRRDAESNLSRTGKKMGWKFLPRDEESKPSAARDAETEVSWILEPPHLCFKAQMVSLRFRLMCRGPTPSRKAVVQPQKKICHQPAGARSFQHASRLPLY